MDTVIWCTRPLGEDGGCGVDVYRKTCGTVPLS
jgi:hypothetical protein